MDGLLLNNKNLCGDIKFILLFVFVFRKHTRRSTALLWSVFKRICGALIPEVFCPTGDRIDIEAKEVLIKLGMLLLENLESHEKQVGFVLRSLLLNFFHDLSVDESASTFRMDLE